MIYARSRDPRTLFLARCAYMAAHPAQTMSYGLLGHWSKLYADAVLAAMAEGDLDAAHGADVVLEMALFAEVAVTCAAQDIHARHDEGRLDDDTLWLALNELRLETESVVREMSPIAEASEPDAAQADAVDEEITNLVVAGTDPLVADPDEDEDGEDSEDDDDRMAVDMLEVADDFGRLGEMTAERYLEILQVRLERYVEACDVFAADPMGHFDDFTIVLHTLWDLDAMVVELADWTNDPVDIAVCERIAAASAKAAAAGDAAVEAALVRGEDTVRDGCAYRDLVAFQLRLASWMQAALQTCEPDIEENDDLPDVTASLAAIARAEDTACAKAMAVYRTPAGDAWPRSLRRFVEASKLIDAARFATFSSGAEVEFTFDAIADGTF
ncbi:MAG: hypothetical protein UHD09_01790 [Bifidobacterium sp.]|nr:hypothetical protein [Bifidobacterium sp.]